jgi:hypothetical protein
VIARVRELWPGWGIAWPLPFLAWTAFCAVHGTLRAEHVALAVIVPLLAYAGPRSKRLFLGLLPIGLLGLVYDSMRYVKDVGLSPERIHTCDLQAFDARVFGVSAGGAKIAIPDYWHAHAHTALDVLCAIPYGTFIYVSLAVAIWLYLRDYDAFRRFGWTFLLLNLVGFVTYHVYPAAPPWYVEAHGCVADLSAHASEGPNLARVDAMLGFGYFHGFYGRSSDVFGAVPSLHVAYPLINLLFGWRHWRVLGRALASAFLVLMAFSAVYLSHHWVVDVVLGVAYTVGIERLVRVVWTRRARAAAAVPLEAT